MVRAIHAGRKTQTRRIIKDSWWRCLDPDDRADRDQAIASCPYGTKGTTLWVREAFRFDARHDQRSPRFVKKGTAISYEADGPGRRTGRIRSPIFMPRWASRCELEIEFVRIERLQDIEDWQVRCEGLEVADDGYSIRVPGLDRCNAGPKMAFAYGWDRINGQGSWDKNPWVWVIYFKRKSLAKCDRV